MAKRVIWIVLDSAGIGAEPDADKFGDVGSDTFGHILAAYPDAKFDNLTKLGLRAIEKTSFYDASTKQNLIGVYGKAQELSNGKDTTTGHWEMIGIHTKHAFPTYPNGFPQEIIDAFIEQTGCGAIYGNKVASGIPIIAEYGEEHMKTGYPIVYTSADSVFQIAASEEKVGLPRLYEMCEIARKILVGEHGVGRVIARPFVRKGDGFERTNTTCWCTWQTRACGYAESVRSAISSTAAASALRCIQPGTPMVCRRHWILWRWSRQD